MKKITTYIMASLLFFVSTYACIAQVDADSADAKKNKAELNLGADLMSRYVWRGLDYGSSPSIQPGLSITKGGLEVGAWGAYSIVGGYAEADLYLSYTLKSVTLTVTDYFFPGEVFPNSSQAKNHYFMYDETTGHVFEAALGFEGPDKFPISIFAGTVFYGADPSPSDPSKNNYSTYLELGYAASLREASLDFFLGFATHDGLYGTEFGVVNLGVTGSKDLKITNDFSLPINVSLVTNPQCENIHIVVGMSF